MKYRWLAVIVVILLAGAALWFTTSRRAEPAAQIDKGINGDHSGTLATIPGATIESEPVTAEETPGVTAETSISEPKQPVPAKTTSQSRAAARGISAAAEAGPGLSPAIVLENMRSVFRQYSSRFGGNPVGNNLEITHVLNGENPAHAVFLNPEDGLRVNSHGELVDNWDTPYFFHQLSRTEMEIHSAGPDRRMWTSDDLVIK